MFHSDSLVPPRKTPRTVDELQQLAPAIMLPKGNDRSQGN
jgi:hypothetical protein